MRISVVTTLFNAKDTAAECLDSVAEQTYLQREHIVIDGGSGDGTLALLQQRRAQLAVLVSEPDGGIYFGLNKGIARATGEVVGLLHADDVYADTQVLSRVAVAFADPAVQAVYGDLQYVARADPQRVIRQWQAGAFRPARLRWGWMPPHPTLFLRRSLYKRFGLFDTRYRIAADYDLILRMLTTLAAGEVRYLPHVLVRMRVGGVSNRSVRTVLRKSWEDYRALRANGVGGVGTLAWKNLSKLPQFVRR
jgi:glycosyltransferase involved in cell wall biosynthesis